MSREKKKCLICGIRDATSHGSRGGRPYYSTLCKKCKQDSGRLRKTDHIRPADAL